MTNSQGVNTVVDNNFQKNLREISLFNMSNYERQYIHTDSSTCEEYMAYCQINVTIHNACKKLS